MSARMIPTVIAIVLGLAAAGEGVALKLQADARRRDRDEAAEQQAASAAALAACQAEQTPKAIDATGRVLEASQASDLADTQLRAAVVASIPQAMLAEAVIATGSPQSIAAYAALSGCWASNTTGDSARSGCALQVPQAWAAAVAALPACPAPVEEEP